MKAHNAALLVPREERFVALQPLVELVVHPSGDEDLDITFDGGSICLGVASGTADSVVGINNAIQYADDTTWGAPGWIAMCGSVEFFSRDASELSMSVRDTCNRPVMVTFTGVADVRQSARDIADTIAAAWDGQRDIAC